MAELFQSFRLHVEDILLFTDSVTELSVEVAHGELRDAQTLYSARKDTDQRGPSVWEQLRGGASAGGTASNRATGAGSAGAGGAGSHARVVPVAEALSSLGPSATVRSIAAVKLSVTSIEVSSVRRAVVDSTIAVTANAHGAASNADGVSTNADGGVVSTVDAGNGGSVVASTSWTVGEQLGGEELNRMTGDESFKHLRLIPRLAVAVMRE
jgi:hypothetical protein